MDNVKCFPGIMIGDSLAPNRTLRADAISNAISTAFPDSKRPNCSGCDTMLYQSDQDETDKTPGFTADGERWAHGCHNWGLPLLPMKLFNKQCIYAPPMKQPD